MSTIKLPQLLVDIIRSNVSKYDPLPKTKSTFKALADAIHSTKHSDSYCAMDLHTDEYVIWMLDHINSLTIGTKEFSIPLSNSSAQVLNIAAKELIARDGNKGSIDLTALRKKGFFAALEPSDRFRALSLLQNLAIDLKKLPLPFWNNSAMLLSIISPLPLFSVFGYYSEWAAYGSTRLNFPETRVLEMFPTSWETVGYPGVSKGYHAFRGYLLNEYVEK